MDTFSYMYLKLEAEVVGDPYIPNSWYISGLDYGSFTKGLSLALKCILYRGILYALLVCTLPLVFPVSLGWCVELFLGTVSLVETAAEPLLPFPSSASDSSLLHH